MQHLRIFIIFGCVSLLTTNAANAQQKHHIFEQSAPAAADTSDFAVYQLYTPESNLTPSMAGNPANPIPSLKSLSGATKFLLGLGTNLIRGDNENYSIYSYEDAWKYPGPTVRYPETFSEFGLYIERYDRYASPTQ